MFQAVPPPIIRSSKLCTASGTLSNLHCCLMLYIQCWAPDDGRRNRLKHVEHFTEIKKLCNVSSCWLYLKTSCLLIGTSGFNVTKDCFKLRFIQGDQKVSVYLITIQSSGAWRLFDHPVYFVVQSGTLWGPCPMTSGFVELRTRMLWWLTSLQKFKCGLVTKSNLCYCTSLWV